MTNELRFAAARGDAFATLCARDARSFSSVIERINFERSLEPSHNLFALVDYATLPDFPSIAKDNGLDAYPLIGTGSVPELRQLGGHVLAVADDKTFEKVFNAIWGRRAGLFVVTKTHLPALLEHLQKFTVALQGDGEVAIFRLYDPRVFGSLLDAITEEQYQQLFDGKIEAAFYETDRSELAIAHFGSEKDDMVVEIC